jgi:hypothetical protein
MQKTKGMKVQDKQSGSEKCHVKKHIKTTLKLNKNKNKHT